MKILKSNKYTILKLVSKYSFTVVLAIVLVIPFFVGATGVTGSIKNPLGDSINDIPSFIKAILNIVLVVGVPIITLAIIYTGFLFVKAQGNSEELTKAKKTLLYVLIGSALLLGSFVLSQAIKSTVDEIIKSQ